MISSLVVGLLFCVSLSAAQTLVTLPGLGSIQGTTGLSYFTGITFYAFLGVPFAERPTRFLPPTKKNAWDGVLDTTSHGRMCPQTSLLDNNSTEDLEDCLFLDVYSPRVDSDANLPVLFFIHGGAFVTGSSQVVTPGFFMEHDVVVVSIQYRLGALGFLSVGTDEISGNAGMYDQVMALQWVYDNIQYFGGDPERITVAGISAGATSAALLYVSPLTQNIIKQGIFLSGSAVAMWSVGTRAVQDGISIAKYAGCERNDQLVSCLQNVEPLVLVKAYDDYQADERKKGHSEMRGVNPVVDGRFLNAMPLEILKNSSFKGRPLILSVAKHEGRLWEPKLYKSYLKGNDLNHDNATLKYGIPDILLEYTDQPDTSQTIATAIKEDYFKPEELGNYNLMKNGITDYLGAAYFKAPARKMAELNNLRGGTSYLVTFNYYMHSWKLGREMVPHGYDPSLLFPDDHLTYTEVDLSVARNLTAIYFNFITTGTPNGVTWEPYSLETGSYLVFNRTVAMKTPFEQEYFIAETEGLY